MGEDKRMQLACTLREMSREDMQERGRRKKEAGNHPPQNRLLNPHYGPARHPSYSLSPYKCRKRQKASSQSGQGWAEAQMRAAESACQGLGETCRTAHGGRLHTRDPSASGTPPSQVHLSASSRMSTSMLLRWKEGQLWRWSMSRPGVAMRISGAARRAAS